MFGRNFISDLTVKYVNIFVPKYSFDTFHDNNQKCILSDSFSF